MRILTVTRAIKDGEGMSDGVEKMSFQWWRFWVLNIECFKDSCSNFTDAFSNSCLSTARLELIPTKQNNYWPRLGVEEKAHLMYSNLSSIALNKQSQKKSCLQSIANSSETGNDAEYFIRSWNDKRCGVRTTIIHLAFWWN